VIDDPAVRGRWLQRAREDAGFDQKTAAERLEIGIATLSRLETGATRKLDSGLLARMLSLYGRSQDDFEHGLAGASANGIREPLRKYSTDEPREPYAPNPALARDYPQRAYQVVLGYLNRLERAGLSHEEIEKFERTLLNRRFAQRFRTAHGVEWTEDDYILHVESLWQAMMDALATRGVVP
jgi:transcriptional regulator with XRE-family HTH domain